MRQIALEISKLPLLIPKGCKDINILVPLSYIAKNLKRNIIVEDNDI